MACYEITHERKLLTVSIETFEKAARRAGAEKDAIEISRAFRKMGFPDEDYSLVGEVTYEEYKRCLRRLLRSLTDETDMIAVCLMSHGSMDNGVHMVLFSCGTKVEFTKVIEPILTHEKLAGRPKIIIAQICRGTQNQNQGLLEPDGPGYDPKMDRYFHETKDSAIYYSSARGNQAWRSPQNGSVFISTLSEVLHEIGGQEDFDTVVRTVNQRMTEQESIRAEIPQNKGGTKEMDVLLAPSYEHCLTKKIRFYQEKKRLEENLKFMSKKYEQRIEELNFANDMLETRVKNLQLENEILGDRFEDLRFEKNATINYPTETYVADSGDQNQNFPTKMEFKIRFKEFEKKHPDKWATINSKEISFAGIDVSVKCQRKIKDGEPTFLIFLVLRGIHSKSKVQIQSKLIMVKDDSKKFYEGKEKYCFTSEDSWAILEQADLKFAKKITIIMTDIKVEIEEK